MAFVFNINGTSVLPYVEQGGFKVTRNDIDSSNAGRTLDGTMHRGRVTIKKKIEVKCMPLKQEDSEILLSLIKPEYVTVDYTDPETGQRTGVQFYSNNVPASLYFIDPDTGEGRWKDISFPLVER